MRARWIMLALAFSLVWMLMSCSGGTPSGGVSTTLGAFTAPYLAVDLASGQLEPHALITEDSLRTDTQWKVSKLLFKRVDVGGMIGVSGTQLGADSDEPTSRSVASSVMFVAVFELTQAQWTALGGQARWLEAGVRAAGGSVVAPGAPAYGLSRDEVTATTAAFNSAQRVRLALPTNEQWEVACRGGTSGTLFWWGDDPSTATTVIAGSPAVTQVRAVVAETVNGIIGPRTVDNDRVANPIGLFDTHGNLWEWVDSIQGTVRGGSWNDTVPQARAANRLALDQTTHHPLVGVRLILVP